MWNDIIRIVNLDGMFRCIECNKDLEYAKEGFDFVYQDANRNKICTECVETKAMENLEKFNQMMEEIKRLSRIYQVPERIIIRAMDTSYKYTLEFADFERLIRDYKRKQKIFRSAVTE